MPGLERAREHAAAGADRAAIRALWKELGTRDTTPIRLHEVARLGEVIRDRQTGRLAEEADLVTREALRAVGAPRLRVDPARAGDPDSIALPRGKLSEAPLILRWPAVSAVLLIVGALGPWERFFVLLSVQGTDGVAGWIGIGAGGLALAALRHYALYSVGRRGRGSMVAVTVLGLIGLGCVAARASNVWGDQTLGSIDGEVGSQAGDLADVDLATLGWGAYVAGLASVSLAVAGLYLVVRGARRRADPTAIEPGQPVPAGDGGRGMPE